VGLAVVDALHHGQAVLEVVARIVHEGRRLQQQDANQVVEQQGRQHQHQGQFQLSRQGHVLG